MVQHENLQGCCFWRQFSQNYDSQIWATDSCSTGKNASEMIIYTRVAKKRSNFVGQSNYTV